MPWASASTSARSGRPSAARAASGAMPMASGSRLACAATISASRSRRLAQRPGSASQSPATGCGPPATPIAASAPARRNPCRRSRSAADGGSGQAASSRPAAADAPRRVSAGGATSRTVAPMIVMPALPGSRSRTRSPTCSGSGSRNVSRATGESPMGPRGRIRAWVRAEPMCRVSSGGSVTSASPSDSRTSSSLVRVQRPDATRAMPRAGKPAGTPRRLTATRATPAADATGSFMDSRPLILTGRSDGVSSSSCAGRDRPGRQRPGDDGAAPPDAERPVDPEPDRGGRVGDGQRRHESFQRVPQFRQAGPGDRADRDGGHGAQAGAGDAVERLPRRRAGIGQVAAGDREQAVPDTDRVDGRQVLGRLRHPAAVGRHHEQHRGHRADSGQHVRHEALVTGHVDERHALPAGQLGPGEAQVNGQPAAPLLGPAVGLHPGQRPHQRRLPVIHVPRGRDHLHGRTTPGP